ncbi:cathepsin L, partial [Diaphorina citri]|uniref:Cathepsin L n=1 Tax=Diaphorina citri TaxID=121845 RepID=A0A3Q0JQA2_DIACI
LFVFQLTHGKKYESDIEENFRLKIYMENKRRIAQHNAYYESGKVSFKLDMNHFGDMVSPARSYKGHSYNNSLSGQEQPDIQKRT